MLICIIKLFYVWSVVIAEMLSINLLLYELEPPVLERFRLGKFVRNSVSFPVYMRARDR